MIIQVEAKTYTSAAEMIAEAKLRRQRMKLDRPHKPVVQITKPPVKKVEPPPAVKWVSPTLIKKTHALPIEYNNDLHVRDWRVFTGQFSFNRHRFHIFVRARDFGLTYDDIMGGTRARKVIYPRHVIMWELRVMFGLTFPEIGKMFGLDHTTALHGVKKVQAMIDAGEIENALTGVYVARRG